MNIHRKRGKYTVGTLFRKGSYLFATEDETVSEVGRKAVEA